jgi:hypothetical protein
MAQLYFTRPLHPPLHATHYSIPATYDYPKPTHPRISSCFGDFLHHHQRLPPSQWTARVQSPSTRIRNQPRLRRRSLSLSLRRLHQFTIGRYVTPTESSRRRLPNSSWRLVRAPVGSPLFWRAAGMDRIRDRRSRIPRYRRLCDLYSGQSDPSGSCAPRMVPIQVPRLSSAPIRCATGNLVNATQRPCNLIVILPEFHDASCTASHCCSISAHATPTNYSPVEVESSRHSRFITAIADQSHLFH